MGRANTDFAGQLMDQCENGRLPFSFTYGGSSSSIGEFGEITKVASIADDGVVTNRLTCAYDGTSLECEIEIKSFEDFPAVEWVVRLRNTAPEDTALIEDLLALDLPLDWTGCGESAPVVDYSFGSRASVSDFMVQRESLKAQEPLKLSAFGGRSSNQHLPFFNLHTETGGMFIAVGWTGQWACSFERGDKQVTVRCGMEKIRLKLRPGEEIRTPSILLMPWDGAKVEAHNRLRRFMLRHHTLKIEDRNVEVPISCITWGGKKTATHQKDIERIREKGLEYDCYWVDAGWFGPDFETDEFQNLLKEDWYYNVGYWAPNPSVHPQGLGPVSSYARAADMKFLLWIEPERAVTGTPMMNEHPEWFLKAFTYPSVGQSPKPVTVRLLNLGLPDARQYITDKVSSLIEQNGVDYLRQDCNMELLECWREADEPDRHGMTEIRYVEGLYKFWDELRSRHPNLVIDNCAGGGTRIDLESIGRTVVLHRTDYVCHPGADPVAGQVGTFGLNHWLPLISTGLLTGNTGSTYEFRSLLGAGMSFCIQSVTGLGQVETLTPDFPWEWQRKMIRQFKKARPFFSGDFYPLTDCTISHADWMAYQLDRPDLGEGMILVYRRQEAAQDRHTFYLQGLAGDVRYDLEDADAGLCGAMSGEELRNGELAVHVPDMPGSRILFYRKASDSS